MGDTMENVVDATWTRQDGAQLVLIGRRLSERASPTVPWRLVRVVEGSRRGRRQTADLWARANGFTAAARLQTTGPVALEHADRPCGETARIVAMPMGEPRIPLEVARSGGLCWARRHDGAWAVDEHLGTAIGAAIGLDPTHRTVLEAAVRGMRKLDMLEPPERGRSDTVSVLPAGVQP